MRYEQLTMGEAQVGESAEGGFMVKILKLDATVDPASVAANVNAEQDFTVTGLKAGDIPIGLESPVAMATLALTPIRVDADDTLTVRASNPTAGAIDIAAGQDITVTVLRPSGL
jgi:hypothetical protein